MTLDRELPVAALAPSASRFGHRVAICVVERSRTVAGLDARRGPTGHQNTQSMVSRGPVMKPSTDHVTSSVRVSTTSETP
jgi:hypothetical protein